jgi:hypothetical protein
MIVDLLLNRTAESDPYYEGLNLIRDNLWPYNRTMFFVVFSAYIKHKQERDIDSLEPHWAFIRKEFDENGALTQECLGKLSNIVEVCRKYATPILQQERYDYYPLIHEIQKFASDRHAYREHYDAAVGRMVESIDNLNKLSDAAFPYLKAGLPALRIGMGVYGSCGRFEMRPKQSEETSNKTNFDLEIVQTVNIDGNEIYGSRGSVDEQREKSDIDYCVFIDGGKEDKDLGPLALMFWNRMKFYLEENGFDYDGKELVASRTPNTLGPDAFNDCFVLVDRYMPLISSKAVVTTELRNEGHVRNRHFQILTELRPVLNGEFPSGI